jgi:hypothetical protein
VTERIKRVRSFAVAQDDKIAKLLLYAKVSFEKRAELMNEEITYKTAGVDIDAGNESLRRIKKAVKTSHNKMVLTGLGTFGSLYDLSDVIRDYKEPVLVPMITNLIFI